MAPKKLVEDPPAAVVEDFDDKDHRNSRYFWIVNTGAVCVALYLIAYDFIPDPTNPFSPIFSVIILYLLAQLVIPAYAFFITWAPKPDLVASESSLDLYTRADERLLRQTTVDDMHQMTEAAMQPSLSILHPDEKKPVPPPLPSKRDWEIEPSELDFTNSFTIGNV
ncbi:hypothetical protein DVH24_005954 [Malus domestica]|uniref:Uncharacterized protein n=1 Tax=Malus domestica TaxID=3750 RepID=A0A498IQG2_MALDO|nr:hypothetical protein DVH24_005954 [Malus domestica]